VLRKHSGAPNWVRADRVPAGHPAPASDQVVRVFEAGDYLAGLADEALLLDESPCLVASARAEQELSVGDGGYVVESMTLVLDEGLGFRAGIDQNTASLLPFLDGTRPLREAIAAAVRARGIHADDLGAFTKGAIAIVRTMLELGFVTLAEPGRARTDQPRM
jgi:hypothetical protein